MLGRGQEVALTPQPLNTTVVSTTLRQVPETDMPHQSPANRPPTQGLLLSSAEDRISHFLGPGQAREKEERSWQRLVQIKRTGECKKIRVHSLAHTHTHTYIHKYKKGREGTSICLAGVGGSWEAKSYSRSRPSSPAGTIRPSTDDRGSHMLQCSPLD